MKYKDIKLRKRGVVVAVLLVFAVSFLSLGSNTPPVEATPSETLIASYTDSDSYTYLRDHHPSNTVWYSAASQSFTNLDGAYKITKVSWYLKKQGNPTGNAHAVLYAHSGTYGSSSRPTGSPLATSSNFDVSTLTTSNVWYNFTFSATEQYVMSPNTYYCVVFQNPTSGTINIDNSPMIRMEYVHPTHSGNWAEYSGEGGGWHNWENGFDGAFYVYGELVDAFGFFGVYDEDTGILKSASERAVNITVYYGVGSQSETFELNGTYYFEFEVQPLYFYFDLSNPREYWLSPGETTTSFYVFDDSTTLYTIQFLDLAGALDDYPFVTAKRYINGTSHIIEKRKVDEENKISMSLINGVKYTIEISDGEASYVFGDLLMTSETAVTLTLKGLEFPQKVILAYEYVRLYAERHNNLSSISMIYQDLVNNTDHVVCTVKFRNGTVAFTSTQYSNYFNVTWASANHNITYIALMDAYHSQFGTIPYRAVMARGWSGNPWVFNWLGVIPEMDINVLFPCFLILCAAGIAGKTNAPFGAFLAVMFACLFAWLGWLPIAPAMLIGAFFFMLLMGLVAKKRRSYG